MGKPHKWAEVIKTAADGKDVQSRVDNNYPWNTHSGFEAIRGCAWEEYHEYRIKPEPVYPVTRITPEEAYEMLKVCVEKVGRIEWTRADDLVLFANAAIRRAIEDGDVILPNKD